jgi:rhamnulokinase
MKNIVAFDLGASSGKVFLGNYQDGRIRMQEAYSFPNHSVSINDSLYWDMIFIYSSLKTGIKKAFDLAQGKVESIGIDSFCNDFGLVDYSGDLLTPVRCYRDKRTTRYKLLLDEIMEPKCRHMLSGNQIAPSNTLMHLASMIQAGQGCLLEKAEHLLFVPDLLAYFLTGKAVSEYTVSSVSEMFDFEKHGWNTRIVDAYQIPKYILGDIVNPGTSIGGLKPEVCKELCINTAKVIAVCGHDTASAFLAAPCEDGNCAIISSGTWSLVGTEIESPIINDATFRYNIANEGGYTGKHRLMNNVMGLWILQELRADFETAGEKYSFDELEELSLQAKPFTWLIDPDDLLFFYPGDMPGRIRTKCMELYGNTPDTLGELARCALESLALKYRWSIEKLESVTGKPMRSIHIIGGGAKDKVLSQFTANSCNKKVLAGPDNATALGNMMVQLIACGEICSIEQGRRAIRNSYEIKEYLPENHQEWNLQYRRFCNIFHLDTAMQKI